MAGFALSTGGGCIERASYRSTTCVTLVGLCEHISRLLPGMKLGAALALAPEDLLRIHPEIPRHRRDRAELCIRALRAAIQFELGRRERT